MEINQCEKSLKESQGRALVCIINCRSAHVRNYALSFPTLLFLLIRETDDDPARFMVNCWHVDHYQPFIYVARMRIVTQYIIRQFSEIH